jgi:hypothetical protein
MNKFENQIPTAMNMSLKSMIGMLRDSVTGRASRKPSDAIEVEALQAVETTMNPDISQVTWFGHSAFLLVIEGKRLLFDPISPYSLRIFPRLMRS